MFTAFGKIKEKAIEYKNQRVKVEKVERKINFRVQYQAFTKLRKNHIKRKRYHEKMLCA